jgi:hypothetical protein
MKLTKQKLEQLILQEMRHFRPPEFDPRLNKKYPQHSRTLSDIYKSDIDQARSLSQGLRFDDEIPDDEQVMEPIDVEAPETNEEPERLPFPTDKFTHGKLSGLRLHTGGGSSDSIIYKMHKTGQEFLNFLDQTIGDVYDVAGAFYNEEYIKSFGLFYGKETEQMLRAYIQHTDGELGHYNDNFGVEAEMRFGPEEY